MAPFDLISAVQGEGGFFALCGIKPGGGGIRQKLFDTRKAVDAQIAAWNGTRDVYFGVAKFATDENRKKENVLNLKAFWLDLDCGPDKAAAAPGERPKGYATKRDAAEALSSFCESTGLPTPTMVDSGGGIHCYWILDTAIGPTQWEAVATALKAKCVAEHLYADPAVFDTTRILRVPGTNNLKQDTPRPVVVKTVGDTITFSDFAAKLGFKETALAASPPPRKSALASSMEAGHRDFPHTKFGSVVERCAQIRHCLENVATVSEPLWRSALSIANKCHDRLDAIKVLSEGHPDYNPADAIKKANLTAGPHSCAQFETHNPDGCIGCPQMGKGRSPISLGQTAPEEDTSTYANDLHEATLALPAGYKYSDGGMWTTGEESGFFYDQPLFVARRFMDAGIDSVLLLLFSEKDGKREIMVPVADVVDQAALKAALASRSMVASPKTYVILGNYIMDCVRHLRAKEKAIPMKQQFGWSKNNETFVVGEDQYLLDGSAVKMPATGPLADYAPRFSSAGSLEEWKKIFAHYSQPGMELYAFCAYTAFGAPLMKFSGEAGAIINMYSPKSGTGKSTTLFMCNSVWGHPKELCGTAKDTPNARITRLGIFNTLPATCDEISNMTGEELSDLAYAVSQGVGKDRMKSNSNELRANHTSWNTIALCSSNSSFYERLRSIKDAPEGELMRVMEFAVPKLAGVSEEVSDMFKVSLLKNYGWAGPVFLRHLMPRLDAYLVELQEVQKKVDRAFKIVPRERFWAAEISSVIMGARIARDADLIEFDEPRMFKWIGIKLLELREEVDDKTELYNGLIGRFFNDNVSRLLEIDSHDARQKFKPVPTKVPSGNSVLAMRHEPNVNRLYIDREVFAKFCADKVVGHRLAIKWLKAEGIMLDDTFKNMASGWMAGGSPTTVHVLDTSHLSFSTPTEEVEEAEE